MNIYVTVEGVVERRVYAHWIPLVNPILSRVNYIDEVASENFLLISGGGYPQYFEVIEAAIDDVNQFPVFDRLVVSVDSEEMEQAEKFDEIESFIASRHCRVQIVIVVQHFCFETWALGNRLIIRPNPQLSRLARYRGIFNVRNSDPEMLPALPQEDLNRSQFAERYLRAALNDRFRNLTYSKANPEALLHDSYFNQVRNRFVNTGHIASFGGFAGAFV